MGFLEMKCRAGCSCNINNYFLAEEGWADNDGLY